MVVCYPSARAPGAFPADKKDDRYKKDLVPDAEVPAAEMMFREELAGRAETAYLFH